MFLVPIILKFSRSNYDYISRLCQPQYSWWRFEGCSVRSNLTFDSVFHEPLSNTENFSPTYPLYWNTVQGKGLRHPASRSKCEVKGHMYLIYLHSTPYEFISTQHLMNPCLILKIFHRHTVNAIPGGHMYRNCVCSIYSEPLARFLKYFTHICSPQLANLQNKGFIYPALRSRSNHEVRTNETIWDFDDIS